MRILLLDEISSVEYFNTLDLVTYTVLNTRSIIGIPIETLYVTTTESDVQAAIVML